MLASMDERDGAKPIDLRPIIARLRDIERKCASMGSRNEEFPLMRSRVAALIARLEEVESCAADGVPFAALARELFPVARLFESVGLMAVGREIAHVERSLRELDPVPSPPPAGALRQAATGATAAAARVLPPAGAEPPQPLPSPQARLGAPVVIAMLLLLVAVATAATIVLRVGPAARFLGRERRPPAQAPVAEPTAPPAVDPTPLPSQTPAPLPMPPVAAASGRLHDEISQARLALARSDIEAATQHLAAAALIDRRNDDLAEIGDRLVDVFLAEAEQAAASGQWERAVERIERARRMAMRFSLDEARVRATERRIGAMERFELLSPQDLRAIGAATGRRAEVRMRDGSLRGGRVEGVAGATLLLQVVREVGGGGLRYTDELPLAEVAEIKIFED